MKDCAYVESYGAVPNILFPKGDTLWKLEYKFDWRYPRIWAWFEKKTMAEYGFTFERMQNYSYLRDDNPLSDM